MPAAPSPPLDADARRRLAQASTVWLTALRRDGSPHTTPLWFAVVDTTVWLASARTNVKVGLLRRDPRVSLAVDGTGPSPLVAQGRAQVHDAPLEHPAAVAALAARHDGWDVTDPGPDGPRVLLEVRIDRWLLAG